MKAAIFGATGSTGIELVKQALEAGHEVTAFVRNPAGLSIENERLIINTGDVFDPASVAEVVKGQDAILCALGAGVGHNWRFTTTCQIGTTEHK